MFTLEIIGEKLILDGSNCKKCNGITRLVGMETHQLLRQITLLTFECLECGATEVSMAISEQS